MELKLTELQDRHLALEEEIAESAYQKAQQLRQEAAGYENQANARMARCLATIAKDAGVEIPVGAEISTGADGLRVFAWPDPEPEPAPPEFTGKVETPAQAEAAKEFLASLDEDLKAAVLEKEPVEDPV